MIKITIFRGWPARCSATSTVNYVSLIVGLRTMIRGLRLSSMRPPDCKRVAAVEGAGVLTATAFIATLGDPKSFKNGRQVAAWLGLTPREHSSGGRQNRMGITKRGDRYLRKLLVHGARSALRITPKRDDPKSQWIERLRNRSHENVASVALAAKNARTLWARKLPRQGDSSKLEFRAAC